MNRGTWTAETFRVGNWLVGGAALGLVVGLAITVPAHQSNPFLAGPGVFLGLVIAAIGAIVLLSLLVVFKKRSRPIIVLFSCFLIMLAVLVLLPFVWPYPKSDGPRPLADEATERIAP